VSGQQVELAGRFAVERRATLGFKPIALKMAVPIIMLALVDKQVITILKRSHAASQAQSSLGDADGLKFPPAGRQGAHLPQMPQTLIQEEILPGD
jgi:hypothetical protein